MNKLNFSRMIIWLFALVMMPLGMMAQDFPCDFETAPEEGTYEEVVAWAEVNCVELLDLFEELGINAENWEDGAIFDGIGGEWTEEDELAWLYDNFSECLDGLTFDSVEAAYEYVEENCEPEWGGEWEWTEEDEMAWFYDVYAECLEGQEFDGLDALLEYVEANCEDDFGGEWSEEDELAFLYEVYGECLDGQEFDGVEAAYEFIAENCEEEWDGDCVIGEWEWNEEDEIAFLYDIYGDCLEGTDFTVLEEIYAFIEANCEDDWTGGWDDEEFEGEDGWGEEGDFVIVLECLEGAEDITLVQEFLLFINDNCGGALEIGIPECILDAPLFSTDEEFFAYIEDNCGAFDDEADDGEGMGITGDDFGALIAAFNLNGASGAVEDALGINNIQLKTQLYPNPATDLVTLNIMEDFIQGYDLYDIKGAVKQTVSNLNTNTVNLNVADLQPGTYLIKVTTVSGAQSTQSISVR